MNSLIILPEERLATDFAEIRGARANDLIALHELCPGLKIRAAELDGQKGSTEILEASDSCLRLRLDLWEDPQPKLPIDLLVAVPRPQTVKKVLLNSAMLGVNSLTFCGTEKGVKSYLQSKSLMPGAIQEQILLGLSQSCESLAPKVELCQTLRYFINNKVPPSESETRLLAVTGECNAQPLSSFAGKLEKPVTLAIGPEAGWSDDEVNLLIKGGFQPVTLGNRILRVETALCCLLAQIEMLLGPLVFPR